MILKIQSQDSSQSLLSKVGSLAKWSEQFDEVQISLGIYQLKQKKKEGGWGVLWRPCKRLHGILMQLCAVTSANISEEPLSITASN